MQQMEKGLFGHITQLAQREVAVGSCRSCCCGKGSGIGSVNYGKKEEGLGKKEQKRNRGQSIEIPCSWDLEKITEAGGEGQAGEGGPEPELEPMPKPAPKRRRLMSDNEILEMELEEIKRIKATETEGHAYSEEPDDFWEGYEGGVEEEGMSEGRVIVEAEKGGDVMTRAVAMGMKKRVLLTTQELLEGTLL